MQIVLMNNLNHKLFTNSIDAEIPPNRVIDKVKNEAADFKLYGILYFF